MKESDRKVYKREMIDFSNWIAIVSRNEIPLDEEKPPVTKGTSKELLQTKEKVRGIVVTYS